MTILMHAINIPVNKVPKATPTTRLCGTPTSDEPVLGGQVESVVGEGTRGQEIVGVTVIVAVVVIITGSGVCVGIVVDAVIKIVVVLVTVDTFEQFCVASRERI